MDSALPMERGLERGRLFVAFYPRGQTGSSCFFCVVIIAITTRGGLILFGFFQLAADDFVLENVADGGLLSVCGPASPTRQTAHAANIRQIASKENRLTGSSSWSLLSLIYTPRRDNELNILR